MTSENFNKKVPFMTKQSRFNYESKKEGNSLKVEEAEEDLLGFEP